MRINWFAQVAACALLVTSVQGAADAKPKRPVVSAAKKAAAAKAAAAKKEADRLAAEAAAKAAAEAAEKARIRAQWGLLADLPDGDYEANGTLVTVRRDNGADKVAMTIWGAIGRLSYTFMRDAAGALSYDYKDGWNDTHYGARVGPGGQVDAVMKNETSWPVLKRDGGGPIVFAYSPGKKLPLSSVVEGSKASKKLASLIASGKVSSSGGPRQVDVTGSGRSLGAVQAQVGSWEDKAMLLEVGRPIHYVSSKNDKSDGFLWRVPCFKTSLEKGKSYLVTGNFGDQSGGGLGLWRGCTSTSDAIASPDKDEPKDVRSISFTKETDLPLYVQVGVRGSGKAFDIVIQELTPEVREAWQKRRNSVQVARANQGSSGNSGWLGGLVMGGMAAAMGGDAGMVMGAAMKGVEMTTDNEMSRAVLAGEGDKMMQSSIETQRQIAETERLRQAAADETRRKREAATTGSTSATAKTASVAPIASASVAVPVAVTPKPAASASGEVRYSFCTDTRTDRSSGKVREVIYYSRIGTIRPGPNGGINFPTGFADFVDTKSNLARHPMSENCPLFESVARAEQDLATKRQIERPGIRDFVYLPDFMPR